MEIVGVPEITNTVATTAKPTQQDPTTEGTQSTTTVLPININTASAAQLELLPGIGPKLAQAIVDYRTEYGNYETPEDLLHVSGIGEKKLAAILDYITTGG